MRSLAPLAVATLLAGCRLSGDEACAIRAAEPLVTIEQVTDSASGAPVPVVLLRDVRYGGFPPLPAEVLVAPERAPVRQATVEGDAVRCVVSCGFGSLEGTYEATLHAPGYRPRTIGFVAQYRQLDAGCPRRQRGGVRLRVALERS